MKPSSFFIAILTQLLCINIDFAVLSDCASLFCLPDWENIGPGVGSFLENLYFQLTDPTELPDLPSDPPLENPPTLNDDRANPQAPVPATDPADIELLVVEPADTCDATPSGPQGAAESTNVRQCTGAKEYIVWPTNCEDTIQIAATETILHSIDSRYWACKDPLCPLKGGVAFWVAKLKPSQIDSLLNQPTSAVKAITPNTPFRNEDLREVFPDVPQIKIPVQNKRNHLRKREALFVTQQRGADQSLTFLSTPIGKQNTDPESKYAFLSRGVGLDPNRKRVRIYMVGTGIDMSIPEFNSGQVRWLYAVANGQNKDLSPARHGTCIASKIAGVKYGVFKNEPLLVVAQANPNPASYMSALSCVVMDLYRQGSSDRGYAVVSLAGGWTPSELEADIRSNRRFLSDGRWELLTEEYVERMIASLAQSYQAVVVTHAGRDDEEDYAQIDIWPAVLATKYDIITVGAVHSEPGEEFGKRFPWSCGGLALTVSAPGNGRCNTGNFVEGSSFASAIVSGLVGYFLSLPGMAEYFQSQPNLPLAVKEYLDDSSIRRYFAQKSVWNGLDGTDRPRRFDEWPGIPRRSQRMR